MANLLILGQTVGALWSSSGKDCPFASRFATSLKVIGTDTDRSATYDFLLAFHTNYSLSGTVSEIKGDTCEIFPCHVLTPPLGAGEELFQG